MRLFELPNGDTLDLDSVYKVGPLNICKHDATFNNYEVYVTGAESINIMERHFPRAQFLAAWQAGA